jgi:hypothetical protein
VAPHYREDVPGFDVDENASPRCGGMLPQRAIVDVQID